ncbi:MAG: protein kinase [Clostridia bacterium]|nr:protein kinase [Clostridia bacterium]
MDAYRRYSGKVLDGRYRLEQPVGSGGMAVVFAAIDTMTGRRVAVKMLRESAAEDPQTLRRFINESRAVAMFNHNNIVKIFDISVDGPLKYIVMEYVDGMTLLDYMEFKKPIDWRDAVIYVDQVLRALDHAHMKGVIHRDIKPQNIMLLEGGYVKVMDFGIAKILDAKDQTLNTNAAIGTVYYISPEQARNKKVDCRTDIYSLGCMLYEMVTGERPFKAETQVDVVLKQINEQPVPPSQINPKVPLGLEQIILCAMQKNPADRYQSASQMLRHIRQFENDPTIVFVMRRPSPKTPTADVAINRTKLASARDDAPITLGASAKAEPVKQTAPHEPRPYRRPYQAPYASEPPRRQSPAREDVRRQQYAEQQARQPREDARQAPPRQSAPRRTSSQNNPPLRGPEKVRGKRDNDTISLPTFVFVMLLFILVIVAVVFLLVKYLSQNIDVPTVYEKVTSMSATSPREIARAALRFFNL